MPSGSGNNRIEIKTSGPRSRPKIRVLCVASINIQYHRKGVRGVCDYIAYLIIILFLADQHKAYMSFPGVIAGGELGEC
jgi:hypothetical protein